LACCFWRFAKKHGLMHEMIRCIIQVKICLQPGL
jgi:hypothetical protein